MAKMNTHDPFLMIADAIVCDPKNGDIYYHRDQVMSDQAYCSRLFSLQYFTLSMHMIA